MNHTIDQLVYIARSNVRKQAAAEKKAFVDPAAAQGGGMADPMAGAAASGMPMDPMAMGGGGAPAGGAPAPGGISAEEIRAIIKNELAASGGGMGGGAGGMEPIKPKIDVNVELMQIKKMIAKMCDSMGVQIPASDMAVNSQDLTQMAMGQQGGAPAGGDPAAAAGGAPAGPGPIQLDPSLVPPAGGAGGGGEQKSGMLDIVGRATALKRIMERAAK